MFEWPGWSVRRALARLAPFPAVRLQGPIEGLFGEEISAAVLGQKPIGEALAAAERRVNEFFAQTD